MENRVISACLAAALVVAPAGIRADERDFDDHRAHTTTPIKHIVVIFQENVSFDHYFGTYPVVKNLAGETPFKASKDTPKSINTLLTPLDPNNHFAPLKSLDLINKNPNGPLGSGAAINGADASNPIRLTPAQALTADQGHNYLPEQQAYNNGKMDSFPKYTGVGGTPSGFGKNLVMGYYDGNTVTAFWNYAQHFALSDNFWTTTFGPSTPGALNLISGQTNGFNASANVVDGSGHLLHATHEVPDGQGNYTEIGDGDPLYDVCSTTTGDVVAMHGRNIGDLLNAKNVTWGWFEGGFDLTVVNPDGSTGCARQSTTTAPGALTFTSADYIPHHQPFQYYASTRNPTHARPSSVAAIGHSLIPHTTTQEPANHQYDINDFFAALAARNLPSVSFLKASGFEDGHPGYSDPLDEQHFVVRVINALQKSSDWDDTAVIIAYDDSDGWYDHQMPPIVDPSATAEDALNLANLCDNGVQQGRTTPTTPLKGSFGSPVQGRCGYGTRVPLLVVSPYAKVNHVDHTLTDQSSILRFIEDNWLSGERVQAGGSFDTIAGLLTNLFDFDRRDDFGPAKLILDEKTGTVTFVSRFNDDGR
ncbi:alkaline phosphatase family protein [Methylocapsa polymorpha]|uniref:Alkaline phosphatase family protein n=1 Tax=Methylocapsa polymorpha TaxID=3080828 RepID=A0ABZ0HW76_9HYPH|nr:alkaline phosphatase family protein [Methylocapsa sp. RX1]